METLSKPMPSLVAQIRHRMTETDNNVSTLAKGSGVARRTVQDLVGLHIPASIRNLEAVARAMGCRLTLTPVADGLETDSPDA